MLVLCIDVMLLVSKCLLVVLSCWVYIVLLVLGKCVFINKDVLLMNMLVGLLFVFLIILLLMGDWVFLVMFVNFMVLVLIYVVWLFIWVRKMGWLDMMLFKLVVVGKVLLDYNFWF